MYSCLLRTEIILYWFFGLFDLFAFCRESSRLLCLACHLCLQRTEIIFVRIEIFVFIFAELWAVFCNF
jgi:hypothetical protein